MIKQQIITRTRYCIYSQNGTCGLAAYIWTQIIISFPNFAFFNECVCISNILSTHIYISEHLLTPETIHLVVCRSEVFPPLAADVQICNGRKHLDEERFKMSNFTLRRASDRHQRLKLNVCDVNFFYFRFNWVYNAPVSVNKHKINTDTNVSY